MVMNELNVTFTLNPAWLAVGAGRDGKSDENGARSSTASTGNGRVIV
jgi:hypothetical protein